MCALKHIVVKRFTFILEKNSVEKKNFLGAIKQCSQLETLEYLSLHTSHLLFSMLFQSLSIKMVNEISQKCKRLDQFVCTTWYELSETKEELKENTKKFSKKMSKYPHNSN